MKRNFVIRRLLAILTIAGLALAPVSRPVMAGMASQASMQAMADDMTSSDRMSSDMSSSAMMEKMAEDMPCCPPKAPAPVGCDKCFCIAACASKCFAAMSSAVLHPVLLAANDVAPLRNDSGPDGLGHPPPEHPPRTLV